MDLTNWNNLLIVIGIVAIIIEIIIGATTGFELFIIGLIFIIGGGIGTLAASSTAAFSSIIVMILAYVFLGRSIIKKSLHITTQLTNVESIIGKKASVVEPIDEDHVGQVKIEGEIWRAESEKSFEKGEKVTIISLSGVTVKVE